MPFTGWLVPACEVPGATDVIITGDDVLSPEPAPDATTVSKLAAYNSEPAGVSIHAESDYITRRMFGAHDKIHIAA